MYMVIFLKEKGKQGGCGNGIYTFYICYHISPETMDFWDRTGPWVHFNRCAHWTVPCLTLKLLIGPNLLCDCMWTNQGFTGSCVRVWPYCLLRLKSLKGLGPAEVTRESIGTKQSVCCVECCQDCLWDCSHSLPERPPSRIHWYWSGPWQLVSSKCLFEVPV